MVVIGTRKTMRGVDVRRRPEDEKEGESLMGAQFWKVLRFPAGPGIPTALPCSPTRGGQRGTARSPGRRKTQDRDPPRTWEEEDETREKTIATGRRRESRGEGRRESYQSYRARP